MKSKMLIIVVAILLPAVILGCSKLDRENYDKIEVGMDYQQVVTVIGDPDKCDAAMGIKKCVWGNENKNITIQFVSDKVIVPSMKGL